MVHRILFHELKLYKLIRLIRLHVLHKVKEICLRKKYKKNTALTFQADLKEKENSLSKFIFKVTHFYQFFFALLMQFPQHIIRRFDDRKKRGDKVKLRKKDSH